MSTWFKHFSVILLVITYSAQAEIKVDGTVVESLQKAFDNAKNGSVIDIAAGSYKQGGVLKKNNVVINAEKGAILHSKPVKGKAALVIKGKNTTIKNLECHSIAVADKNGACVRLEGMDLLLDGVYFHDSEQGLLTNRKPGLVEIRNSRFERLGKAGRAHGIYVGGGKLMIDNSHFLASKGQGHEIKSRAKVTMINRSVVASMDGRDSRLVDISNGGELVITDSVLQQGNKTSNSNLIGFGMEGIKHKFNSIELRGNLFILDRQRGNQVLRLKNKKVNQLITQNAFIGKTADKFDQSNFFFEDRESAKLEPYPYLPPLP